MAPSAVCPIPTAYTPASAHAKFLEVKKKMPGLTPAAWRKQAAIEMGLDYDTYLALWKANKGTKGAIKLVPESTPTVPAAASSSPTMGIKHVVGKEKAGGDIEQDIYDYAWNPNFYGKVHDALRKGLPMTDEVKQKVERLTKFIGGQTTTSPLTVYRGMMHDDKLKSQLISKWKSGETFTDDAFMSTTKSHSKVIDFLNDDVNDIEMVIKVPQGSKGYYIGNSLEKKFGVYDQDEFLLQRGTSLAIDKIESLPDGGIKVFARVVDQSPKQIAPVSDTAKAVGKAEWKPTASTAGMQMNEIASAFKAGKINIDEAFDLLDEAASNTSVSFYKLQAQKYKEGMAPVKSKPPTIAVNSDIIQTVHGPLTHDLASSVYKKMKKDMPGATPATLRHAAADYLGVDYNDYLKAWKKPTTAAQKAKQTTASKLPPNTNTPLSSPTVGKYANKSITEGELKDELARLYGPQANKNFINPSYNDVTGEWTVQLSNFLAPTPAAKKAIVEGLEKLGLKVDKHGAGNNYYDIKPISSGKKTVAPGSPYKIRHDTSGNPMLEIDSANEWTRRWSRTVSQSVLNGVRRYTTSAYREINSKLRKGGRLTGDMKAMSDAMPEVVEPFTVFRGCGDEWGRSLTIDAFTKGEIFEDKGFMSTAITTDAAWRGVRLIIELPKGTKGMYIDHISSARGEMEYLLDAGTKFRVLSVQTGHNKYDGVVRMVAIPH